EAGDGDGDADGLECVSDGESLVKNSQRFVAKAAIGANDERRVLARPARANRIGIGAGFEEYGEIADRLVVAKPLGGKFSTQQNRPRLVVIVDENAIDDHGLRSGLSRHFDLVAAMFGKANAERLADPCRHAFSGVVASDLQGQWIAIVGSLAPIHAQAA